MPLTEEQLHLLYERTAIKHFDGKMPLEQAEREAQEELFGDKQEGLWERG